MCCRQFVVAFLVLITTASTLQAGVIPGRWEKVDALPAGTPIIIILKGGDRMECTFQASSADSIALTDSQGQDRRLPKSAVLKIHHKEKGSRHCTKVGLGLGLAGGAATRAAIGLDDAAQAAGVFGLLGAGLGSLVGYSIDRIRQTPELLFKAP